MIFFMAVSESLIGTKPLHRKSWRGKFGELTYVKDWVKIVQSGPQVLGETFDRLNQSDCYYTNPLNPGKRLFGAILQGNGGKLYSVHAEFPLPGSQTICIRDFNINPSKTRTIEIIKNEEGKVVEWNAERGKPTASEEPRTLTPWELFLYLNELRQAKIHKVETAKLHSAYQAVNTALQPPKSSEKLA